MDLKSALRRRIKAARKRQRHWVRAFDLGRLLFSAEGQARLWTMMIHRGDIHQTTPHTAEDRYPDLFDFLAVSMPEARRILSFGCSTGEELIALRKRLGSAEIVGAEINSRSRRIAARRVAGDGLAKVVAPDAIEGHFDIVLALAVALMRLSKNRIVSNIARFYVSVIRGTPLLVQLFVIFYGMPSIGLTIDPWPSAIAALLFVSAFLWFYRRRVMSTVVYDKNSCALGSKLVTLDDSGVRQTDALNTGSTRWEGVVGVEETADHIFLMIDRFAGYIVPKRSFFTAAEASQFVRFAREHLRPARPA